MLYRIYNYHAVDWLRTAIRTWFVHTLASGAFDQPLRFGIRSEQGTEVKLGRVNSSTFELLFIKTPIHKYSMDREKK